MQRNYQHKQKYRKQFINDIRQKQLTNPHLAQFIFTCFYSDLAIQRFLWSFMSSHLTLSFQTIPTGSSFSSQEFRLAYVLHRSSTCQKCQRSGRERDDILLSGDILEAWANGQRILRVARVRYRDWVNGTAGRTPLEIAVLNWRATISPRGPKSVFTFFLTLLLLL